MNIFNTRQEDVEENIELRFQRMDAVYICLLWKANQDYIETGAKHKSLKNIESELRYSLLKYLLPNDLLPKKYSKFKNYLVKNVTFEWSRETELTGIPIWCDIKLVLLKWGSK